MFRKKRMVLIIGLLAALLLLVFSSITEAKDKQHQEEYVPKMESGKALIKINFKLPKGEVIQEDTQQFYLLCDLVNAKGVSSKVWVNIVMMRGYNSYTAYRLVDASGGSTECKVLYNAPSDSGYLGGLLTKDGMERMPRIFTEETDHRKSTTAKAGSTTEITIEAIKGVLFSTTFRWSNASGTIPNNVGVQFYDKSIEGGDISYYQLKNGQQEIKILETLDPHKEYELNFYVYNSNFYLPYGDIKMDGYSINTGKLVCPPITIDFIKGPGDLTQEEKAQLVQSKVKDIISRIIKPGMNDLEKEYAIFRYIQNNTVYGGVVNSGNAYGCLIENLCVCSGYAEGTKALLDAVGIENKIAYGVKGNGVSSGNHAWNIVKIDGEYFQLDALWNRFNMNDTDAKKEYYEWEEGSIPACNSHFSIPQGLSFFVCGDYIYYTSLKSTVFYSEINRCKVNGSANTKVFATKNSASYIFQQNGWIYYFAYEGSKVYKVKLDGTSESLLYSFDPDVRIHTGGISSNVLYLFAQTGINGNYKKSILKLDLGSPSTKIVSVFSQLTNYWFVGDYFFYYKFENGVVGNYKMTLDGKVETRIQ